MQLSFWIAEYWDSVLKLMFYHKKNWRTCLNRKKIEGNYWEIIELQWKEHYGFFK